MKLVRFNRVTHRWGSALVAVPVLLVIVTGILLLFKKEVAWIQPPTQTGASQAPAIGFDRILESARTVPEAAIRGWDDVDRLDVRPGRGMVKVRAKNRWEVQVDTMTGAVLQVAYRRSDLIESIHDGSFFHERLKLWLFLPTALILTFLWMTGIYLFVRPYLVKRKSRAIVIR